MVPSPGARLGGYQIISPLGAGGMGEVYRANDPKLGRTVAIKVLPARLVEDAGARERLRREAMAAAALDHPFICKVFEFGEDKGVLFIVMEFIAGETLFSRIHGDGLPHSEALKAAGEILEALEEAHRHRLVHRDLKPSNVMLTHGHVKVMDFGLAKRFDPGETLNAAAAASAATKTITVEAPELTATGAVIGTPDYMSPEQLRGEPLDQRSDLFSFGILLCELLGNPHPFRRRSPTETLAAILRDSPDLAGGLPQGLMLVIRRLLAKPIEERYYSAAEVRPDLVRLAASPPDDTHTSRIPLIGREPEFAQLQRALEEALAGRGSLVMVGGEPGIGKTHLTGAILREAKRRGAFAATGHCYEMEGAPPYVPFIEMLEYSVRTSPREGLRQLLGGDAPEVAKLMPELRNMYPEMPAALQLPPEQQRRFLFNAYRSFVERSARMTPIVAVLEDLHWADEPTLLLLQHLAQTLPSTPMLLIGTYRDMELQTARPFAKMLETLLRQKQATRMTLRRLPVGGVQSMLAAMSGQPPPPSLARVVFEETEGNPFFVEEVFRHLSEEGKLFDETGKWRPGLRVDQLQVPEGVRLVLGRRLERLGGDARRALTTAAVIGRSFSLPLLEELENRQPDAVLDAVEEAERAHLLTAEPVGRETRYRFVHELVRQTLAETLSLPRRQRLHARVAEAIERLHAANLEAHAPSLAHHLYQAGAAADPEKTTTYLTLTAKRASAGAAHEEALTHLDNALSLWEGEQGGRTAELLEQRAAALRSIGRREEAARDYGKAITMFENAGAAARAAEAGMNVTLMQLWQLDYPTARHTIERAIEQLGSADPRLQISLLTMRALLVSSSGDVHVAAGAFAEARALRNAAGGERLNEFNDRMEAFFLRHSMQWEPMLTAVRQLAQTNRAAGDLWAAADVEWESGYAMFCGRPAEAAGYLPEALSLAERVGHHLAVWMIKSLSAKLCLAGGNLMAAEQKAEEAWNFGEAHASGWSFSSDTLRGEVAFLRGNLSEAERWFRHRTERQTHVFGWKDASLFALWAESKDDRARQAWTDRRWSLPRIGQLNPIGAWMALERSVIGLAWLGAKEEAGALRPLTEELIGTGVWAGSQFLPFRTAAGIAAACTGDWSAAEQHHLTGIRQTDTAPYAISQPTAREWYAKMLLDRRAPGDEAKAGVLLREAEAMYESMDMPFHAKRVRLLIS